MKNIFKLSFLAFAVALTVAACNNSKSTETDADSTTTGVVDSMPVDSTASGDTAVVVPADSTQH